MQPPTHVAGVDVGNWGRYPKEYDRAVHGRYDPGRYYGKPDTPFSQVKLAELPAWFGRREIGVSRFLQLISRAYWRWQHAYVLPKKCGVAPFFQVTVTAMVILYIANYPRLRPHRNYKYH